MNILITGGAGYIGSVLTDLLLKQGHTVSMLDSLMYGKSSIQRLCSSSTHYATRDNSIARLAISRPGLRFFQQDLRDLKALENVLFQQSFDSIVHLAAIVGINACKSNPVATEDINVRATIDLYNLAVRAQVKHFVFASTYSIYGNQLGAVVTEDSPIYPIHLYEKTKQEVEKFLQQNSALSYTIFRFATACGLSYRTRYDLLSNQLALEAGCKRTCTIYQPQDLRSFVHVQDIAQAVSLVLTANPSLVDKEIFNVGEIYAPGEVGYGNLTCSKESLLKTVIQSYKTKQIEVTPVLHQHSEDARNAILIAKKLHHRLKFQPQFALCDSIAEIRDLVLELGAGAKQLYDSEYFQKPGADFRL